MLSLPKPSRNTLQEYFQIISSKITTAVSECSLNIRGYFTPKRIEEIVLGEPNDLIECHKHFLNYFFNGMQTYNRYVEAKNRKKKTPEDDQVINLYNQIFVDVTGIFDYNTLISQNKKTSYALAKVLDRNTCTYCNRQYTLTVSEGDANIIRPQFAHWLAKSVYPILALSFYNLIPSCSICNSSIKGQVEFSLDEYAHPYLLENIQNRYTFSYKKKGVSINNITISTQDSKIDNCIKAFKLEEVYNAHSLHELKDLLELRYKYPKNYIKVLINDTFDKLHMTENEAYRMIFGVEYEAEDFHKRPFSKFKKDIIEELKRAQ